MSRRIFMLHNNVNKYILRYGGFEIGGSHVSEAVVKY